MKFTIDDLRLTRLLWLLISVFSFQFSAFSQTNVTATLSITNLTQTTNGTGAYLTLQSQNIVWTNSSVASLLLQPRLVAATNTTARAATNLYTKLRSTFGSSLFINYGSSTSLVVRAPISTTLSASVSTNWGFLTFTTNQIATTNMTGSLAASNLIALRMTLGTGLQAINSWDDVTNFFAQSTGVGGSATNVYLGRTELATVTTNAEGNWTVNVTTNAIRSVYATELTNTGTTRLNGTNWLGTVRLPMRLQTDTNIEVWTNAYATYGFPPSSDAGIEWWGPGDTHPSFGAVDGGPFYGFYGMVSWGITIVSNRSAANKPYLIYDADNERNFLRATNPAVATAYTDLGPGGVTNTGGTFTGNAASLTNFTHGPVIVAGGNTTVTTNSVAGTGQKVYTVASTAGESFFWTNPVAAASVSNAFHVKASSIVGTHYGDGSALSNIASATTFWFTNPAAASAISNALDAKTRTLTASEVYSPLIGPTNAADLVLRTRGVPGISIYADSTPFSPDIVVGTNVNSLLGANSILGGYQNAINGSASVIAGGSGNQIPGLGNHNTISGGQSNSALSAATFGTIPGGRSNTVGTLSFAAGHRANATNQGAFVWNDSTGSFFGSTSNNQFLVNAAGGVGINTNNPGASSGYALVTHGSVYVTDQITAAGGKAAITAAGRFYSNPDGGSGNFVGGAASLTTATSADNNAIIGGTINAVADNSDNNAIIGGQANRLGTGINDRGQYSGIFAGYGNTLAAVGGTAQYSGIFAGRSNTVSASYASASGLAADAAHAGAWVWGDSSTATPFSSTAANQFLIRATGGVGINTNNPGTNALAVLGTVSATKFQGDGSEITGLTNFSILNVAVAKMTNIIYPSREIVLFETNASLVAGGKTTIFLTNHCLFTNWASMIGDGNWGNVTFTNSTASHWNVYVPTNLFLLTNDVGGHFFLDGFGGTNVAFVVSNGFKAKLQYEFEGASLRAGEATFRLHRPTAIP